MNNQKRTILITGSTGVMGGETLKEFSKHTDKFNLKLFARPGKKNLKKLKNYINNPSAEIIWGDLRNFDDVKRAVEGSDVVLHIGGMVSPVADHFPELTLEVNERAAKNIVEAIKLQDNRDDISLVYIGSVAQTGNHDEPTHWGRTGDPIMAADFDYYAISKIKAERIVAESGLKKWVSLRQSGILHPGLIFKGSDPISFHVPLRGVLEWATVEDSARLMVKVSDKDVPEDFWQKFYNIGSGKAFRLTNYEFEKLLLDTLGCPPPEKVFETSWFATRNFHGEWYVDSDRLNEILPFREEIGATEYFKRMKSKMPWYMALTPLAPAFIIKLVMKQVAKTKDLGTLNWLSRNDKEDRIKSYFGSREAQRNIPSWDKFDLSRPSEDPKLLSHGYDEEKAKSELDIEDMKEAAKFRGGKCNSDRMDKGDLKTPLEWECGFGHKFMASPNLVLKGGHWCPECLPAPWRYEAEAKLNPFLAQVWRSAHPEMDD